VYIAYSKEQASTPRFRSTTIIPFLTSNICSDTIGQGGDFMELEKIISQGIMAILPVYIPMKGNCSCILTFEGERHEFDKRVNTMLMRLSRFYFIDLKSIKRYYGNLLNVKNLIPVPLDGENIFIPLKVRKPILRNDGSIGYVNIKYIERVTEGKDKTIIHLRGNHIVECLNSMDTVNKHIKNGSIIKRLLKNSTRHIKAYDSYMGEYDRPATKGDVALIISEILRIRESIK